MTQEPSNSEDFAEWAVFIGWLKIKAFGKSLTPSWPEQTRL